jgi:diguanylate cyclase (GGDEF)-like protein
VDPIDALEKVKEDAPEIIISDVRMPKMDGYETCRLLKQNKQTRDIPIIFITATDDWNNEAQGLELGAADYITKPVRVPIVRARIRNHIALRQAQAELARKNKALERLATHDTLTNLYNRRKLDARFAQEISRAERYGRPLSVIMLDIDHFKKINDTHGHPTGDAVLTETAKRLARTLRDSDILGRWGGEEFMVICPETELDTAVVLAERLREDYANHNFPKTGRLTASFGVSAHHAGLAAETIISRADQALYRAKAKGRNRVEQEKNKTS